MRIVKAHSMNIGQLFTLSMPIDFEVDVKLEDCLERVENYRDSWLSKRQLRMRLSSVKEGVIYGLWADDGGGFAHLDFQLEASGNITRVTGTAHYAIVPLIAIILFASFILPAILIAYQADFIIMLCPVYVFPLLWLNLISSRYSLLRRVKKILGRAPKPKRA